MTLSPDSSRVAVCGTDIVRTVALAAGFTAGGIGVLLAIAGRGALDGTILWFALAVVLGLSIGVSLIASPGSALRQWASRSPSNAAAFGLSVGASFQVSLWAWSVLLPFGGSDTLSEALGFLVLGTWNGLMLGLVFAGRSVEAGSPASDSAVRRLDMARNFALAAGFGAGGIAGSLITGGYGAPNGTTLWFAFAGALGVSIGVALAASRGLTLRRWSSRSPSNAAVLGLSVGAALVVSLSIYAALVPFGGSAPFSEARGLFVLGIWNGLVLGLVFAGGVVPSAIDSKAREPSTCSLPPAPVPCSAPRGTETRRPKGPVVGEGLAARVSR